MKFLFDLFPLLVFFGSYKWAGSNEALAQAFINDHFSAIISGGVVTASQAPIIIASLSGIVATAIQIASLLLRRLKVDGILWLSLLIFVMFGGLTIYFHDDNFIKWKPTIIYWCFAVGMMVAHWGFRKNLMRAAMEKQFALPEEIWHRLNLAWMTFWVVLGFLNLFVAFVLFRTDTGAWVSFKVFGVTGIMFVFIIAQTLYLTKHIKDEA
ncbi:septation protein A [Massilia sp. YIM B04103]|uniref:septation protein A n=1 Tax=Massilia sp. YIM B04103 TaxID=2963106 RepID=UPI002109E664|nr:septation protein A [Massilia sp. YIM B04103]